MAKDEKLTPLEMIGYWSVILFVGVPSIVLLFSMCQAEGAKYDKCLKRGGQEFVELNRRSPTQDEVRYMADRCIENPNAY